MSKILSKLSLIIATVALVLSSCSKDDNDGKTTAITYGTMTDQDGNVYKTVTIGTQTWMAENLRTTKYNDGTAIPFVTAPSEWGHLSTAAYCNYRNTNNTDTIATFGRLYNWYAVNNGKLAPTGWHVPTDAEWSILTTYLGGEDVAYGKLKETGTTHWISPDIGATNATNETGFTALPGGCRSYNGFNNIGNKGYWWSGTELDTYYAWGRGMANDFNFLFRASSLKETGFSVRCVRD